jgi:LacI family transcriptional regulator
VASITEVARLAGVSVATASRVMSDADYPVSAAARERVLDAARTLDYVPNALARGLLKSQVPVVGVIVHDITDPYFAEVVRGVEDAASPAGFLVITCSSERDPERERSYVRLLRSMRAAAIIFAGSGLDDPALNEELPRHLAAMREQGAAVVHLSPHALGPPEIQVDNAGGVASLVAALVELGHRRIAFLAGPRALYVARDRLAGYRAGLAAAGIQVDERLIVQTSFDREGGALAVDTLLAGEAPFTAMCAANDQLALGALERLRALGIAVPDAVSVAGFDDISMASMTAPSLSTVRLPLRELGRLGFAFADRVLAGEEGMPALMPTEVVLRDSTAAPSASPIHLPFDLDAARDRVADRGPVAGATDVTTPAANLGASA